MEFSKRDFEGFKEEFFQFVKDQNRMTVDLMRQETRAVIKQEIKQETERIVRETVRSEVRQIVDGAKQDIISNVNEIVGGGIVPQIDDHDARLVKLEKRFSL